MSLLNRISFLQDSISTTSFTSSERNSLQLQLADACNELKDTLWTALLSSSMGNPLDASAEEYDADGELIHSPISDNAVAELLRKNFSRRLEDKLTADEIIVSQRHWMFICSLLMSEQVCIGHILFTPAH
jgi:hypothetical protein